MKGVLYFLSGVVATLLVLVLLSGQPVIPNAHAAGKKVYKVVSLTSMPGLAYHEMLEKTLNSTAQEGWEFVSMISQTYIIVAK